MSTSTRAAATQRTVRAKRAATVRASWAMEGLASDDPVFLATQQAWIEGELSDDQYVQRMREHGRQVAQDD